MRRDILPSHLITSSLRASSDGVTLEASTFAVLSDYTCLNRRLSDGGRPASQLSECEAGKARMCGAPPGAFSAVTLTVLVCQAKRVLAPYR